MKHLMEWEVSSVELTLGNVQLVNYHCRDVYKLWRDCDMPILGGQRGWYFSCNLMVCRSLLGG